MTKSKTTEKTIALTANVPVIKSPPLSATSPPLPAKPPPVRYKDFDEFADEAEELAEFRRDISFAMANPRSEQYGSGDLEDNIDWVKEKVARCEQAIGHWNDRNSDDDGVLKRSYVATRLSVLIGSFPNAVPHSGEAYMKMLTEEVAAFDGLDAIVLESACREIARTQKFAPAISEMLEVLNKQSEQWERRYRAIWYTKETLARAIVAREKWEAEEKRRKVEQKRNEAERKRNEARKEWERKLDVARRDLETANNDVASSANFLESAKAHVEHMQSLHRASIAEAEKKAAELAELETIVAAELAKLDADEATATKQNGEAADRG
jgi:hypothetical protein